MGNLKGDNYMRSIRKSSSDKLICGVCGGIASFFNISSSAVRFLFVITGALPLYIGLALVLPSDDR